MEQCVSCLFKRMGAVNIALLDAGDFIKGQAR